MLFSAYNACHGTWLFDAGWSPEILRGAFFLPLVLSVFGLVIGSRPAKAGMFRGNPAVLRMLLWIAAVMSLVYGVPLFRHLLGIELPGLPQTIVMLAVMIAVALWLVTWRRLGRSLLMATNGSRKAV